MGEYQGRFGPHNPEGTYVPHAFQEHLADLGEIEMNYAVVGDAARPPLLLIPGQTESWWGYEQALPLLAEHFQAYAVDLRGQGRSSRTPGRYTLDNMGNDLVRFIDLVIGRPTYVSGLSSGGVLSAWLSAYAKPDQVIAAHYEDPPLFASEVTPACGHSIKQGAGVIFKLWSRYLGDQWSIGDWAGLLREVPNVLPAPLRARYVGSEEPRQNLKEYDPEWARAFIEGTMGQSCDHEAMLRRVRVPVLFTHHFRVLHPETGRPIGAISDVQADRVKQLLVEAGVPVDYRSFEKMGHSMHGDDPQLFSDTVVDWVKSLGD